MPSARGKWTLNFIASVFMAGFLHWQGYFSPFISFAVSMMRQLLDIVNQAVQVPLRIHLRLRSQREAIQAFVVPKVGEHWFDDRDAPAVEPSSGSFLPVLVLLSGKPVWCCWKVSFLQPQPQVHWLLNQLPQPKSPLTWLQELTVSTVQLTCSFPSH